MKRLFALLLLTIALAAPAFAQIASVDALNPRTFGAKCDGTTDDTAAFNLTIAAANSGGKAISLPVGDCVLTDQPTAIVGHVTVSGAGPFKSRIIFRPTANNKAAIKLSNGVSRVEEVVLRDFAIYSDDATYTKIAIDVYDLSYCQMSGIMIYGTGGAGPSAGAAWSGNANTSIGIRTHGREVTSVRQMKIVADRPVVISANPNTAATIGEDMDHWHWSDLYLVGNANYNIQVDDGLGIMETVFDGFQAWVGGTGGFKINDTRVAPTVPSRGIKFSGVRTEQITDVAGYAFNMAFTEPVQSVEWDRIVMATGSNGISLNGFQRATLTGVVAAMTSTQLITAGVIAKSSLSTRECLWQSGGTFTTTGLTRIASLEYRSADFSAPSTAFYAGQITDTSVNVEKVTVTAVNTAVGFDLTGTTGDRYQLIPQAAGSGVLRRGLNNAGNDYSVLSDTFSTLNWNARNGVLTSTPLAALDSTGLKMALRMQEKQGVTVASTNNLTLGTDGNRFQISGVTQINLLANTNWQGGSIVSLHFQGIVTVKHNQVASGNNKPIFLKAAVDLVTAAGTQLVVQYDSTDSTWYQIN